MRCNRILAAAALVFTAACSSGQLGEQAPPNVSPGTVTLRLQLPSGQSFCDVIEGCAGPPQVFIGTAPGNWLTPNGGPFCAVECSNQCAPTPCPAIGACVAVAFGVPVTNVEMTWDGSYVNWSTCGSGTACFNRRFVPPGRYVARLCATPGTLIDASTCTQTAPEECVEATFDLPGPPLVEVPLTAAQGS